ncbi:upstream stimulatory factor 1 isoform X2 [Nilaparvata lugens]|uniref:upstream stimulatory factor 1 isoform X2 n=1 Tax=Nilaparvata lugens TaxID=108931 RepID=UPI000B988FE8|nr:upstream stimulatory factor 1 isoform X2 [Nilaparvata lugens]
MDIIENTLDTSEENDDMEPKEMVSTQSLTIVEEDGSLDSPDDKGNLVNGSNILEEEVHYQFRPGEGVTYRVVHVQGNDSMESVPQIVSTSSPTYSNASQQTNVQALLSSQLNGQFYVIGSPQDVFSPTNQRSLSPRATRNENGITRTTSTRDDKRRATHNEVERRRRDKINNWIMNLSKIIPDCAQDTSKGFETQSKGGILAKACDYITELKQSNTRLHEYMKENEQLIAELEMVSRQMDSLKLENHQLREQLVQHGIIPNSDPLS